MSLENFEIETAVSPVPYGFIEEKLTTNYFLPRFDHLGFPLHKEAIIPFETESGEAHLIRLTRFRRDDRSEGNELQLGYTAKVTSRIDDRWHLISKSIWFPRDPENAISVMKALNFETNRPNVKNLAILLGPAAIVGLSGIEIVRFVRKAHHKS